MAKIVFKNPGKAFGKGELVGCAFASRIPKTMLSTLPDVLKFYNTARGLHFGKFL